MRRSILLLLWLGSSVGCAALLGVDLDPSLQLPGSGEAGVSGSSDRDVTADGCVRTSCVALGVACGQPDDQCGGTLRCTDCADGCTPSNPSVACVGRCGAVGDGCGGFHDCGASACGDAGAICFENSCCEPRFECGDACGVSVPRGCGLGSLECPGPGFGDGYVCYQGKRCRPQSCGSRCNVDIDDGCGQTIHCDAPQVPAVCHLNEVCFPQECGERCDGFIEQGCGLGSRNCNHNICAANQCCVYDPGVLYSICQPNQNPQYECLVQ